MAAPARALGVLIDVHETAMIPMAATTTVYEGWLLGHEAVTGDATEATNAIPFCGVAMETVDNSAGASADKYVKVCIKGRAIIEGDATLAAAAGTGHLKASYTTDGDTISATPGAGSINYCGYCSRFENVEDPFSRTNAVVLNFGYDHLV